MRRNRKGRRTAKKSKLIMPFVALIIILLSVCSGYITYHYNYVKYCDNFIYPGVTVEGVSLSEKTKEQAKDIIESNFSKQIVKKNVNINVEDKNYTLSYSKINPKYNVDDAVNNAFNYGKNSNILKKYFLLKSEKGANFKLNFSYDDKPIKELINKVQSEVNRDPVNATLQFANNNFSVVPEVSGKKLDKDKLEKETLSKIDGNVGQDSNVNAQVKTVSAKINADMLKGVDSLIATYSTNFGASSPQRANNIVLATKSINGKILMPGDIFSFNDIVGERTEARGYEPAPVIIGNKLESGLGGGICQVSTTLYNAVYKTEMASIEREHHTMPVHYVPQGMDATVDYGNIDYKFKNTLQYPVYIQSYIANSNIVFNLYSNSSSKN
ncbi:hypothetical protein HBE96_22150 [Clostridium sp. P21]|uniref:YoaR-like putative peptidoglycan binding domain-containing protein n=1 Tax=Clostridium muellerianum TaxID=2716538 RepID=A0A7Y0EKR0_9CLOT|nr:VanW family protein [Clostridium muellerianum]NMM65288.1 hypothetical protein [Clostridium muellerianum]